MNDIEKIKKFKLLPYEIVVVTISRSMSPAYSKNFKKTFEEIFPDNKLLFIPEGMEISSIIKQEEG